MDDQNENGFVPMGEMGVSAYTSSSSSGSVMVNVSADCAAGMKLGRILDEYKKTLEAYRGLIVAVKNGVALLRDLRVDDAAAAVLIKMMESFNDAILKGEGLDPIDL